MSQKEKAVISDALKMEGVSEALKKATGIGGTEKSNGYNSVYVFKRLHVSGDLTEA